MQADPTGSVAEAPVPETAETPTAAPDTGSTEAGVSSVESRGDEAEAPSQPTPDDESAEDDGDDEGTDDGEQTEEQKKLSRRERQRLREQERIEKEVAERLAAKEREAAEAAERTRREAEVKAAREAAQKEFAEYIGEDGEEGRLQSEIADLHKRIRTEIGTLSQEDFDKIEAEITAKEARVSDIRKAQGFQTKIAANIWNGIEAHITSPLAWPELADPATKQRYLTAEGGIAGALNVLKDVLVTSVEARKDAEIEGLKKSHASEVATLREEMRGWRVRAGAEEVPDTTSGGAAANGGGVYTRERLRQMMQSSEGMAEYRRNKAEIERQERAGLIR